MHEYQVSGVSRYEAGSDCRYSWLFFICTAFAKTAYTAGRLSKKNASLAGLSTSWQGIRTKGIGKTVKSAAATRAISEIVGPKAKKTKTGIWSQDPLISQRSLCS